MDIVQTITTNPVFIAIFTALALSVANFLVGSFKAWANHTFEAEALDGWVRSDGQKLVPIFVFLGVGQALTVVDTTSVPGLPAELIATGVTGYGLLQLASFIIATVDSLRESITPNPALKAAKEERAIAIGDPIPES